MWWHRYDSVTVNGDLSWQNQLNDQNKPFFDLSDGIFVNYTWEVCSYILRKNIGSSATLPLKISSMVQENFPKLSADVAGDRKFDVYMGIDVFGRGTYGGGQWTVGFQHIGICSYIDNHVFS